MRCKSWVPVLSLRQGAARTSQRIEPHIYDAVLGIAF